MRSPCWLRCPCQERAIRLHVNQPTQLALGRKSSGPEAQTCVLLGLGPKGHQANDMLRVLPIPEAWALGASPTRAWHGALQPPSPACRKTSVMRQLLWQLATGNWQLATGNWQLATGAGYFDHTARAMLAKPQHPMAYGLLQHWPPLRQGLTHCPWLGCA